MKPIFLIFMFLFFQSCTENIKNLDAEQIAQDSLILDSHIDVPYRLWRQHLEGLEIDDISGSTDGDFDFIRARKGGLNVPFFSIYLPASTQEDGTSHQMANELIDMVEDIVTLYPKKFILINSVADLGSITKKNIVGIALGMENGAPIQGDLSRVQYYFDRGIRYITLTHSKTNHISDSSYDENIQWHGLSEFGKNLIEEMNKVGIMVDISHVNDEAFYQAIEISQVPVIASHSSLRYFTPGFERNVDDAMLSKLAEKGGVIQINFGSSFISKRPRDYLVKMNSFLESRLGQNLEEVSEQDIRETRSEFIANNPYPYASLDEVLDHFDRVLQLVGIDHIGIGSDYDGVGDTLPIGLKDVSTYPALIQGLLERGYSRKDIQKILGGNLIRVWKEVEEYAERN
ncbi:MAG: dipeptidase [Gammaproteobacteria bacterium]|jgi:membrane dipeptidase|nr:dipeptidase [SAR86 cluster bacterium]GIT60499.1 MAG: dipeptidase [Gammaproteobacteria bacterium]|tara:strand:- start:3295 stop:4497 length:1203 start_codon:yes stop_codon:yes gene_type:complete